MMFKVFNWHTELYLFSTDCIPLIHKESTHLNRRLIGVSETQYIDVYPNGRRILTEQKNLTEKKKQLAKKLYKTGKWN